MDASAELKRELRGEVSGLDRLGADGQQRLLEQVRAAHRHQRKELDKALNEVLDHIPALLRGAARKIFFS